MIRRQQGMVACLAVAMLLAGGCERRLDAGAGKEAPDPSAGRHQGRVYVAQLLPLHPLYPELLRLDEMIAALRRAQPERLDPPQGLPDWARPQALGPGPVFAWPLERWHQRQALGGTPADAGDEDEEEGLPEDLQAGLTWRRRQAQREMEQELLQARADLSAELSARAVRWTLDAQERMAGASGTDGSATEEAIRAEVDARVEDLRRWQEEYLRDLERSRREVMEGQISAAREAALRAANSRRRAPAGLAGDDLAEAVREALQPMDVSAWPGRVDLSLPPVQLPAPPGPGAPASDAAAWAARRDATAAALVASRNSLQDRMLEATALAAERVARRQGLSLRSGPPGDHDPDLTGQVGNALRGLWSK